jgi:hypothetical protein
MSSLNRKIMREIHNEQHELESSLDGDTLFQHLKDLTFLDDTTKKLLWRIPSLDRTFFGTGFLLESTEYEDEDEVMQELYDLVIRAFMQASLLYQEPEYAQQPALDILAEQLGHALNDIAGLDYSSSGIIKFLADLIECETLAAWLLVSRIE